MNEKSLIIIGFSAIVALVILFTTPVSEKVMPAPINGEEQPETSPETPTNPSNVSVSTCRPTGCSGQVCADEEVMTTCEYREEYACYQSARCERQANGGCGWTETPELQQCLSRSGALEI